MTILSSPLWPSDMPDDRRVIAVLGMVQILEEGMDNAELAIKCGAVENEPPSNGMWCLCMTQDMLDRFALMLTDAKDAEIARLTEEVNEQARLNGMGGEREADLRGKIERLNALVAMQSEFIESLDAMRLCVDQVTRAQDILSATSETVSAWQSKRDNEIVSRAFELAADNASDDASEKYCRFLAELLRAKGE